MNIIKKEDIVDAISKMNVMEICEIVKLMEKKFNISTQNNVIVNTNNDNKITEKTEKKIEQTQFDIILTKLGNKLSTIKAVRSITTLGLKESKDAVENLPYVIKKDIFKKEAESIKKQFEDSGSTVEIK